MNATPPTATELQQLRRELAALQAEHRQAGALSALGALTVGVAHELNNPLCVVKNNVTMLTHYLESLMPLLRAILATGTAPALGEAPLQPILDDIDPLLQDTREGIARLEDLVTGLRGFARIDGAEDECFDLNHCVADSLRMARNELKYRAQVSETLGELPPLWGKPGAIQQLLLNLLINTARALPEFGEIRLCTQRCGDEIRLSIADPTQGRSAAELKGRFLPFFARTATDPGLGLNISQAIVTAHGGRIKVSSQAGVGSLIEVFFPAAPAGGAPE